MSSFFTASEIEVLAQNVEGQFQDWLMEGRPTGRLHWLRDDEGACSSSLIFKGDGTPIFLLGSSWQGSDIAVYIKGAIGLRMRCVCNVMRTLPAPRREELAALVGERGSYLDLFPRRQISAWFATRDQAIYREVWSWKRRGLNESEYISLSATPPEVADQLAGWSYTRVS